MLKKSKNVIGLSFDDKSVSMIELSGTYANNVIENYAITHLEEGVLRNNKIVDENKFVYAIQNTWKQLKTKNKNVAIALSMDDILIKQDTFSSIFNDNETYLNVENSISKTSNIEEVYLDFIVSNKTQDLQYIYMVAAKKEFVNNLINFIDRAGLNVMMVDIDGHVIERSVVKSQKIEAHETYAFVNITNKDSDLHIMYDGELIYEKTMDHNIQSVLQSISRDFGIDNNQALMKLLSQESDILASYWIPFVDGLAVDLKRALNFYLHSDKPDGANTEITRLWFTGHEARIGDMVTTLGERLSRECIIFNPLIESKPSKNIVSLEKLVLDASILTKAYGLALRSFDVPSYKKINLLPWRQYEKEQDRKNFINNLMLTGIVASGLVYGYYSLLDNQLNAINADNTKIEEEIAKRKKEIELINEIKENKKILLKRQAVVENLQKNKFNFVSLINFISSKTTNDVRIKEIEKTVNNTQENIKIVGVAMNNAIIANYVSSLGTDNFFDNVNIVSIKKITLPNGSPGSEFVVTASKKISTDEDEKKNTESKNKEAKEKGGFISDAKKIYDNTKKLKGDSMASDTTKEGKM